MKIILRLGDILTRVVRENVKYLINCYFIELGTAKKRRIDFLNTGVETKTIIVFYQKREYGVTPIPFLASLKIRKGNTRTAPFVSRRDILAVACEIDFKS